MSNEAAPTAVQATATSADRLGFTLFLALALHVILILGVGFGYDKKSSHAPTLDIILAQNKSQQELDEADYLAQFNQQGSGTLDEKAMPTSDIEAEYHSDRIEELQKEMRIPSQAVPFTNRFQTVIITESDSEAKVSVQKKKQVKKKEEVKEAQLQKLSQKIASLRAQFEKERQEYAGRPRIHRVTAASARQSRDAEYLFNWQRQIETVGNANYPAEAKMRKVYGELRLMVRIKSNGLVDQVQILSSSGQPILDDAAKRIVKLATPFPAFTDEMKKDYDQLEVIRTWKFHKNNSLTSR